jgi:hypothetical protein
MSGLTRVVGVGSSVVGVVAALAAASRAPVGVRWAVIARIDGRGAAGRRARGTAEGRTARCGSAAAARCTRPAAV